MAKILVHITRGPEDPSRAALGMLVAKAAADEGHEVAVFLAADAVQLMRDAVLDGLNGLGTGSLRESFDAVVAAHGRFYVSGMSSKARGVTDRDLAGKPAEFAMPNRLVQLAARVRPDVHLLTDRSTSPTGSITTNAAPAHRHAPPGTGDRHRDGVAATVASPVTTTLPRIAGWMRQT